MHNGKPREKEGRPLTREDLLLHMHRSIGTAKRQIAAGKRIHPLAIVLHGNTATTLPIYTDNEEIRGFCKTILDCYAKKVGASAVLTMYEEDHSPNGACDNPHEIHMVVTADSPCCHFRVTTTLCRQGNNTIAASRTTLAEDHDNPFTGIIWPSKCSSFN